MNYWNLAPATGEYLTEETAHESPLEPGVFLYPAHSTTIPKPATGERQAAVVRTIDGVATAVVVPDWRGVRYWRADGMPGLITELAIEPPPGAVFEQPQPSSAELRTRYSAAVQQRINRELIAHDWDSEAQLNLFASLDHAWASESKQLQRWIADCWDAFTALADSDLSADSAAPLTWADSLPNFNYS